MGSEGKFPPQHQDTQPGKQYLMHPQPQTVNLRYRPSNKLLGKVALVTGGDSGIGRAACFYFSLEGATIAFTYVKDQEDGDAADSLALIKDAKIAIAKDPIAIDADLRYENNCKEVVDAVINQFGRIDVLVNNAGVQFCADNIEDITGDNFRRTFETNIFGYFYMAKFALRHMERGSCIINTTSAAAYHGIANLVDYSSSKGAAVSFTRSLALQLIKRGIRVNGVAPGPIWTPLQVASLPVDQVVSLGSDVPMGRAGMPYELGPTYVFLASNDCSSYITGQVIHPNGGNIFNC